MVKRSVEPPEEARSRTKYPLTGCDTGTNELMAYNRTHIAISDIPMYSYTLCIIAMRCLLIRTVMSRLYCGFT